MNDVSLTKSWQTLFKAAHSIPHNHYLNRTVIPACSWRESIDFGSATETLGFPPTASGNDGGFFVFFVSKNFYMHPEMRNKGSSAIDFTNSNPITLIPCALQPVFALRGAYILRDLFQMYTRIEAWAHNLLEFRRQFRRTGSSIQTYT